MELDETHFDAIIIGTGLPQSMLAAALSFAKKKVLHLDANEYYGGQWATLNLKEFHFWTLTLPKQATLTSAAVSSTSSSPHGAFFDGAVYSCDAPASTSSTSSSSTTSASLPALNDLMERFRSFSIDLNARFIFGRGAMVNLLRQCAVGKYLEFKAVDDIYILSSAGLSKVPLSKSDVFQSSDISLLEKRQLMKFVQLVSTLDAEATDNVHNSALSLSFDTLSDEAKELNSYMDRPFLEYLNVRRLPNNLRTFLLYGIALADEPQESVIASAAALTTRETVRRMNCFIKSVGQFGTGPFLFPLYGCGEFASGFSRMAAVFGATYMLRVSPSALVLDDATKRIAGVQMPGGQFLSAKVVISSPDYVAPKLWSGEPQLPEAKKESTPTRELVISRAVVVVDRPVLLKTGNTTTPSCLIVLPPASQAGNVNSVRVCQIEPNLHVSPSDKFILYFQCLASHDMSVPQSEEDKKEGMGLAERDLRGAVEYLVDTAALQPCSTSHPVIVEKKPKSYRPRPVTPPPNAQAESSAVATGNDTSASADVSSSVDTASIASPPAMGTIADAVMAAVASPSPAPSPEPAPSPSPSPSPSPATQTTASAPAPSGPQKPRALYLAFYAQRLREVDLTLHGIDLNDIMLPDPEPVSAPEAATAATDAATSPAPVSATTNANENPMASDVADEDHVVMPAAAVTPSASATSAQSQPQSNESEMEQEEPKLPPAQPPATPVYIPLQQLPLLCLESKSASASAATAPAVVENSTSLLTPEFKERPANLLLTGDPALFLDFDEDIRQANRLFSILCPNKPFLPNPNQKKPAKTHFEDDPDGLDSLAVDDEMAEVIAESASMAISGSADAAADVTSAPDAAIGGDDVMTDSLNSASALGAADE